MSIKGYDTIIQLKTQSKVNVLLNDTGWHSTDFFVGRYLTSDNPTEKRLTAGEVELLSANGINIVSLYEKAPKSLSDYSLNNAETDVVDAVAQAAYFHQPNGTPIYFCIDAELDYTKPEVISTVKAYIGRIKTRLASSSYNPNGYTLGVYGPETVCIALKNQNPSIYTMKGNPQSGSMTNYTIKQTPVNSANYPSYNGVTFAVDHCTAKVSSYGGWQYHLFNGAWQNYNNSTWHRRKCSICNQYERQAHVPNAAGTRCIVCGYEGPMSSPQEAGEEDENE